MRIIFLGPPGSGKGTQAKLLGQKFAVPQLSTGDLLRSAVRGGSAIGRDARKYMDAGRLVPDDLVIQLILDRMQQRDCANGFILDGFPRTLVQAEALERAFQVQRIPIDAVISFELPEEVLVERLTGRRVCPNGHGEWHIKFHPPQNSGFCDTCHAMLVQREDDQEDKIKTRFTLYRKDTAPLKQFYAERKLLKPVNAQGTLADITKQIETVVQALETKAPAPKAGR